MKTVEILVCALLLVMSGLVPQAGKADRGAFGVGELSASPLFIAPILRIETGQHTATITRIDLDKTGHWLVSASLDKTVRVWDTQTGDLKQIIRPPIAAGNEGKLYAVAISPDGELVACGGWTKSGSDSGQTVYLFSRHNGRLLGSAQELTNVILSVAFSPDGRFLAATLGGKNGVALFELESARTYSRQQSTGIPLRLVAEDRNYADSSYGLHFSPDGKRLVTACDDGFVRLYDLSKFQPGIDGELPVVLQPRLKRRPTQDTSPFSVKFSPDGTKLAVSLTNSSKTMLLDAELNHIQLLDSEKAAAAGSSSIAWSSDGQILYTASPCGTGRHCGVIHLWSAAGRQFTPDISVKTTGSILDLAAMPSGGLVLAASDPSITILNGNRQEIKLSTEVTGNFRDNPEGLQIAPDGSAFRFGYKAFGNIPASFALPERKLSLNHEAGGLTPISPLTHAGNLSVKGWKNTPDPTLNNLKLTLDPNEVSRSLSIAPDQRLFVIGGDWYLRCFDSAGRELWKTPAPGTVWATNITADGRMVLAAYGDGTIRWYRMSDGKELLAFFPHADKKRWVLWTPEGFFDHSPGGEELIGYHLNRGKDKAAEFIPVSKLYNAFYRPDLIDAAFSGKDLSEFAKAIDINKLLTVKTLPPKVRFLTKPGTSVQPETEISAEVCDNGGGIGDITIYLNDMPITVASAGRGINLKFTGGACSTFTRPITLNNGDNRIGIMAYNKENNIESDRDSVVIKHTSSFTGKPNLHILTIAVDRYRDGDLQLKFSNADANALSERISDQGATLFGKVNRYTLSDANVTREKLERTFAEIGRKTRREDMFILFVAGHGITYSKDGSFYYLPVDFRYSQVEDIPKLGVSMNDFKRYLANIQATKSLLLLDTCNSGSFAEAIASRGVIEKTAINKLTRAVGRHTLVASSKSQVALEGYEGHGAFSWTLLDGIGGKAANKKGQITVNSLVSFVETELPDLTYKKWGYEQIPQKSLVGEDFQIGVR